MPGARVKLKGGKPKPLAHGENGGDMVIDAERIYWEAWTTWGSGSVVSMPKCR